MTTQVRIRHLTPDQKPIAVYAEDKVTEQHDTDHESVTIWKKGSHPLATLDFGSEFTDHVWSSRRLVIEEAG